MNEEDKIYIASKYAKKRYDYEALRYGDDMYENPESVDDVISYMEEYYEIGSKAFYEKYKEFNLY